MHDSQEKKHIQKLTRLLLFSGCLNVSMAAFLYWWTVKEAPPIPLCAFKPVERTFVFSPTKKEAFSHLKKHTKEELISLLRDKTLIEDGYRKRDLALSLLVSDHYMDVERALFRTDWKGEKRLFSFDQKKYNLFPSLRDHHFVRILNFLEQEKWPLTPQGLFLALQKNKENDTSLKEAFCLTQEFFLAKELFQRANPSFSEEEILLLLLEGEADHLFSFAEKQQIAKDLSLVAARSFLLPYIKTSRGALFLFRLDPEFVTKQLSDEAILALLHLVKDEDDPAIEAVAKNLLALPRGSLLWQAAKLRVKQIEALPEEKKSESKQEEERYTVKTGDSLWKIARRFHTSVEELKRLNDLKSENLRPGKELIIGKK